MSNIRPRHREWAMNDAHRTLGLAVPLAAVGGFLDAFTYVGHGHVFANAMSGNVVLTAIALQRGDWDGADRTLSAIAAFLVGVGAANAIRLPMVSRVIRRPHITALLVELILLVVIGMAPRGASDDTIVLCVTFVAAVQTSTFRQLGDWAFTSTMSTGNLRSLADAIVDWMTGRNALDARKIAHFGLVCLAFFFGALTGDVSTVRWGDSAALAAATLVAICVILLWQRTHSFVPTGRTMRGMRARTFDPSQERAS